MSMLRFTKDHEYLRLDGDVATVGISDYAQVQLGDIVFVDLPKIGKKVTKGSELAVVESVKAASEVYAPVSGEVVEVNAELGEKPALVNDDPLAGGWLVKIRVENAGEVETLMDEAAYAGFVKTL
ncbi:glycine cleavage system protein GcvH [Methylocystis sp. MJC1]|uniref:glycine cleavage system protein GcvH n=1 Tax=Methylocystis sp. MJC1 TaxID=2654282 RepID=UPI0013ED5404|nr:glycine cleavage system protein GcvH [Methylocystis sp. MJC1]MBU6525599.1 glycine cleavage system protein GcvH [Methylocystis sp. MJC1]UZX12075.1 glycine cleavage system protein GcvH [Methylocystis sp. MJC1]